MKYLNNQILKAIKEGLNNALQEYNEKDPFYFKDEWIPTGKDWFAMIENMNNFSNLHNIFNKIISPSKYIRYYLIAKALAYPNIDKYFSKIGREKLRRLGLFYEELHIVEEKNIDIPEEISHLISDFKEGYPFGGLALSNQDLGNFCDDKDLFVAIDNIRGLKDITFYPMPIDYMHMHDSVRIIKFELDNGSICYTKISKESQRKYNFKSLDGYYRNIDKGLLKVKLELYLRRYLDEKIVDSPSTLNVL